MNAGNRVMLDHRIKEYLTDQVHRALQEDFELIRDLLPEYVERYSLKELMIILRLEVDKRKRKPIL